MPHGSELKFGTTTFSVRGLSIVICASGVSGADRQSLKTACERIGAVLLKEWRDDATHMVAPQVSWTPKILTALAAPIPIVNMAWVQAVGERTTPTQPLPDVGESRFTPALPPAGSKLPAGVHNVDRARAKLFDGHRITALPPTDGDTVRLLKLMGAQVSHLLDAGADSSETATWPAGLIEARAASTDAFLLPKEAAGERADAASKAVAAAGAMTLSPMQVRTALIWADLQRGLDQGRVSGQPPPSLPRHLASHEVDAQAATQMAAPSQSQVAAPSQPQATARAAPPPARAGADATADAAGAAAPPRSRMPAPAPAAVAPVPVGATPAASTDDGWQPRRRKEAVVSSTAPAGEPLANERAKDRPAEKSAAADPARVNNGAAERDRQSSGSARSAAAAAEAPQQPKPLAPVAPKQPEVTLPGSWRKRTRTMPSAFGGHNPETAPAHEGSAPGAPVPLEEARPYNNGKRFRKAGPRGPGALVRVRMETVHTGLDGRLSDDEKAAEEEVLEGQDELFDEALQRGATGRRR